MSTNSFLWFCAVIMTLVAANPLIQTIPFQTGHVCQQNAYNVPINGVLTSNVPGNMPMNNIAGNNIPILIQQPSKSNAYPYSYQQPSSNVNPCSQQMTNINPYGQALLTQTQTKPSCQLSQAAHPSKSQLNQLFINKLLENPTIRTMMDPNTRLYNQNGAEIQRQIPFAPSSGGVPSVVNNYFILPPELLINNETNMKKQNEEVKRKSERNQGEERRRKKPNKEVIEKKQQDLEGNRVLNTNKRPETNRFTKHNETRKYNTQTTQNESIKSDDHLHEGREKEKYPKRQDRNRNSQRNEQYRNQNKNQHVASQQPTQNTEKLLKENNTPKERQANKNHRVQNTNERKWPSKSKQNQVMNNGHIEDPTQGEQSVREINNIGQVEKEQKSQIILTQKESVQSENLEQNEESDDSEVGKGIELKQANGITQCDIQLPNMVIRRNSKDELIIQDFRNKFPAIPEDLVRNLLSYMKKQIQNEQLGIANYYYPSFPASYDNFYQYPNIGGYNLNNSERGNERQKSNRENRNKKRKRLRKKNDENNNSETTIELVPILTDDSEKHIATTTELAKPTPDRISSTAVTSFTTKQSQRVTDLATKFMELPQRKYLESEDIIETTTLQPIKLETFENNDSDNNKKHFQIPQLGTEDVVPTIFVNGIIDDYYPDFTADNKAYVISNEQYALRNLHENRYHYTTDRNIENDEINKEKIYEYDNNYPIKHFYNSNKNQNIETVKPRAKSYDEVEGGIIHNESIEESEEIQFRTPPSLELPDFETKQIDNDKLRPDRDEYFEDFDDDPFDGYVDNVSEKTASYSNVKTPQYNTKSKIPNEVRRSKRKKPKDSNIETIFARSKVVNYGKAPDNFEESVSTPIAKFDLEEKTTKDVYKYTKDGAAIIVAESIGRSGELW